MNGGAKAPVIYLLKSFQVQLEDFEKKIPDHLMSNGEFSRGCILE